MLGWTEVSEEEPDEVDGAQEGLSGKLLDEEPCMENVGKRVFHQRNQQVQRP